MIRRHYRAIFISDCHLGFKRNSAKELVAFLKGVTCDKLYLVGDIIDFWELEKKFVWSEDDTAVIRQILRKRRCDSTQIYYVVGNHDDVLRRHIDTASFEGVCFANEIAHVGLDGRRYLVIHGDHFDNVAPVWKTLSKAGGRAYSLSIAVNDWINWVRRRLGLGPWSLSAYLKQNVKRAVAYINHYEDHMIEYCREGNYDGAVCGHIHHAQIREIDGLAYMNCGDWVESCTALVETVDGRFEIVSPTALRSSDRTA